jgi:hypothetical protein
MVALLDSGQSDFAHDGVGPTTTSPGLAHTGSGKGVQGPMTKPSEHQLIGLVARIQGPITKPDESALQMFASIAGDGCTWGPTTGVATTCKGLVVGATGSTEPKLKPGGIGLFVATLTTSMEPPPQAARVTAMRDAMRCFMIGPYSMPVWRMM